MDSLRLTDEQSAAVAKSATTRVALADIEAAIQHEFYCVGLDLAAIDHPLGDHESFEPLIGLSLSSLTICLVVMKNGYMVIGKTAPADPLNYDAEIGRKFSREDAIRQLWPLMGYALRDRLANREPGDDDL